jgi:hypothetical protein
MVAARRGYMCGWRRRALQSMVRRGAERAGCAMQSAGIAGPAKSWSRVQRFGRRWIQGGRGLRHPGGGVRTSGQDSDDVVVLSTGECDRQADDMGVTREMLAAGEAVLAELDGQASRSFVAREVYLAMARACRPSWKEGDC